MTQRQNIFRCFALTLVAACSASSRAEAPKVIAPSDFAYKQDITTLEANASLYEFSVDELVYRHIANPALTDVCVFNAAQQAVPLTVQHHCAEQLSHSFGQSLSFFPIQGRPTDKGEPSSVVVQQDATGKVLSARFSHSAAGASAATAVDYLVDLQSHKDALSGLEFTWGSVNDQVVHLDIESSDDLRSWQLVASDAVLATLSYAGQALEQKGIEFSPVHAKFLRIAAHDESTFNLQALSGTFVAQTEIELVHQWKTVQGAPVKNKSQIEQDDMSGTAALYDTAGMFPVDSLLVEVSDRNTLLKVRLASSERVDGPWHERYSGAVYQLSVDDKLVKSPPIKLGRLITDRYWMLRVQGAAADWNQHPPQLQIGWVPHQVRFVAQGAGPFSLGYGSVRARHLEFALQEMLAQLKQGADAAALKAHAAELTHNEMIAGGPGRLIPPKPAPPAVWKKWAIWISMILALLALSAMAFRLYREMAK